MKKLPEQFCRFPFLIILLLFAAGLQAQGGIMASESPGASDSSARNPRKRSNPLSQNFSEWLNGKDTFYTWDSTLGYVQRYNKAIRNALPYTDLGVIASPMKLLWMEPFTTPGFQTGFNPYPLQNKDPDKMFFYKAGVPFTKFNYVQGGFGVFILDALHTQNITKTWNITIDFNSTQNGELYTASKQFNLQRGTMIGSHYTGKKGRYSNVVILSWNRGRRTENFGLQKGTDTFFFSPAGKHIYNAPLYYPGNGTSTSSYGTYHHVLTQKYFLSFNKNLYLFLRNDWKKEKYAFKETASKPDSVLYGKNPVFNSGPFTDSAVWLQFKNEAGIGNSIQRDSRFPLLWKISASTNRIVYNTIYKTAPNIYYSQGIHALLAFDPYYTHTINAEFTGDYFTTGFNAGDYKLQARVGFQLNKLTLSAGLKSQSYTAPLFTQLFSSNYQRYINNFGKVNTNAIFGTIKYANHFVKLNAGFQAGNADNFIFTDAEYQFKQTSGLRYANISGGINLRAGKWFLDNQFSFQTHNKQSLVPMPKYSDIVSLYFQSYLFKKALLARIGTDIFIIGSYKGYQYNPEMAVFAPTQVNVGNYPVADVFFTGEIKTVQFFVKMEHLNQRARNYGFNPYSLSAVGYPMEPLRLRLGLNWRFYN